MQDHVYDDEGTPVAIVKEGDLFGTDGTPVGRLRNGNVYDRNGKFIFHLWPARGDDGAGRMTAEAVRKLLHPNLARS